MALNGRRCRRSACLLSGVKRTSLVRSLMSANDPKRTYRRPSTAIEVTKIDPARRIAIWPSTRLGEDVSAHQPCATRCCRWVFALRDALLNRVVRITGRSSKSRPRHQAEAQKNQCGPHRAINCARVTHLSSELPAIPVLSEIPRTADRTSVEYPMTWEKRTPRMLVAAYPRPPHGPHADRS